MPDEPTDDDLATAADDDVTGADPEARPTDDAAEPPRSGADDPEPAEIRPEPQVTSDSGAPGIPPPVHDDRVNEEGLPLTTTTGDPAKDYRGPSVTEVARAELDEEPALDEPGYADLGHAEDYEVLRDD